MRPDAKLVANRFGFTGRELDAETGLYYYRARYYSSELGSFISPDPIGFNSGQENMYAYVANNPLSWTDPLGLYGTCPASADPATRKHFQTLNYESFPRSANSSQMPTEQGGALHGNSLLTRWEPKSDAHEIVPGDRPADTYATVHTHPAISIAVDKNWELNGGVSLNDMAYTNDVSRVPTYVITRDGLVFRQDPKGNWPVNEGSIYGK